MTIEKHESYTQSIICKLFQWPKKIKNYLQTKLSNFQVGSRQLFFYKVLNNDLIKY